ncbi:MAG TPA: DoxX family protein [Iamia sp.]|nr:DoxX family protein [Iamia sp.]
MTVTLIAEISAGAVAEADSVAIGVLVMRVLIGITFAAHGYFKFFKGGKIAGTARWFDSMRMRPNGTIHAYLAACTELGAGTLLALGFLTPLACAAIVGQMVVAAYTANRENGFWSANKGWEYNFVLGVVAVGLATIGPGQYSIDHVLELSQSFDPNIGLSVSLFLGVAAGIGIIVGCYRPPAPEPEPES